MGSVRCYESGGMHYYDDTTALIESVSFQQPPTGYAQFDLSEGKFSDGWRFVCVCASTNSTDAAYAGSGAWDTRSSFGADCQVFVTAFDVDSAFGVVMLYCVPRSSRGSRVPENHMRLAVGFKLDVSSGKRTLVFTDDTDADFIQQHLYFQELQQPCVTQPCV